MKKMRCLRLLVGVGMLVSSLGGNLTAVALETSDFTEAEAGEEKMLSAEQSSDEAEESEGTEEDAREGSGGSSGEGNILDSIRILSFNPGYSDSGEYFELVKLSNNSISLAGLSVFYTTSSGKEYEVYEFPKGSEMVGESLLMRLASSDEVKEAKNYHEVADEVYTRNMAQGKGKIELRYTSSEVLALSPGGDDGGSGSSGLDESGGETVVDENGTFEMLCWGFEDERCFSGFNSKKPTVLVRNLEAEEMEDLFTHVPLADYTPKYNPEKPGLVIHEVPEEKVEPKCRSLEFSEIFTYYENSAEEQFIEIFNRSEEEIEISGCYIKYKNKTYRLSEEGDEARVEANSFFIIYPIRSWGLSLTKNPTSMNTIEIIDTDGETVDTLSYFSGQKKGVSLAQFGWTGDGQEVWRQTYILTPGTENQLQEFKTCPVGKVINLETGNCVNETAIVATQAACPEGKYRNPLTGRCKSYVTTTSAELKPCAEGYERNPETGRCRKIVKNDGAEYPVEMEEIRETRELVAIWAIVAVVTAGVGYIVFQYREEIGELIRRR